MHYSREDRAREFVESALARDRCQWCHSPWRTLYRQALCRSCYENKARLRAVERRLEGVRSNREQAYGMLRYEAKILRHAIEDCKELGQVLDHVLQGGGSPLDLENDLCWLSRRISRKDLFSGYATQLGWIFGSEHIRFLRCLIWKIISTEASRHRRGRAQSYAIRGDAQ